MANHNIGSIIPMDWPSHVVSELRQGLQLVLDLRDLNNKDQAWSEPAYAGEIIEDVLSFMTKALAILGTRTQGVSEEEIIFCGEKRERQEHDNAESPRKMRKLPDVKKILTTKPYDNDGYVWNKYGQKYIQGAKHQRNYYRCTQHKDQSCGARKQVQKADNGSPTYNVTYIGRHTCHNVIHYHPNIDNHEHQGAVGKKPCILSFNCNNNNNTNETNRLSRPSPIPQGAQEEHTFSPTDSCRWSGQSTNRNIDLSSSATCELDSFDDFVGYLIDGFWAKQEDHLTPTI